MNPTELALFLFFRFLFVHPVHAVFFRCVLFVDLTVLFIGSLLRAGVPFLGVLHALLLGCVVPVDLFIHSVRFLDGCLVFFVDRLVVLLRCLVVLVDLLVVLFDPAVVFVARGFRLFRGRRLRGLALRRCLLRCRRFALRCFLLRRFLLRCRGLALRCFLLRRRRCLFRRRLGSGCIAGLRFVCE